MISLISNFNNFFTFFVPIPFVFYKCQFNNELVTGFFYQLLPGNSQEVFLFLVITTASDFEKSG